MIAFKFFFAYPIALFSLPKTSEVYFLPVPFALFAFSMISNPVQFFTDYPTNNLLVE